MKKVWQRELAGAGDEGFVEEQVVQAGYLWMRVDRAVV